MNVVLITVDCLRRDRCGIYNHYKNTTPTIDSIGQDGFVFDNAYSTGPVTTESFPGILAGRLSGHTSASDSLWQKCLPNGAVTLASHLFENGWSTAAIISNPRIGKHVNSDHGFEKFHNIRSRNDTSESSSKIPSLPQISVGQKLYTIRERVRQFESLPFKYELPILLFRYYQIINGWPSTDGKVIIDELLNQVSNLSDPFFAWAHLMDVHGPIHPRIGMNMEANQSRFRQFRSHAERIADIYSISADERYNSAVRYVDNQIRRVVEWLKERNIWDETAIIITSDHGDALYDRGIYGHPPHYMYNELLKIPLIIRHPDHGYNRVDRAFSLGWLHEVVTEICGVKNMNAPLSSSHDSHFLRNGSTDDVILADSITPNGHSIAAVHQDQKRVVQLSDNTKSLERKIQPTGTYHLGKDPTERTQHHSTKEALTEQIEKINSESENLNYPDRESIDQRTEDLMKQLGYTK